MAITATRPQVKKKTRINIRTTEERKASYERAAELKGIPLTAFAEQALDEAAERIIAEEKQIRLTERDCQFLMDLLVNPAPEPTPALIEAAEDLKESQAADG